MKRRTAALLALAVAACLALPSAGFFFRQANYEASDWAANALSVRRASHFAQLYGCYSRWGFYHPGPALFYVQAWGEWLLHDFLPLCRTPFDAQLLTQLCLGCTFLVAALRAFTLFLPAGRRRGWFIGLALAFASVHFADDRRDLLFNTWPACPPALLMFCLLATGAAVASGAGGELPFLILAGGFLLHSHVAQPLFVLPLTLLAYAGLLQRCATSRRPARFLADGWRAWPRVHFLSAALVVVFAAPLVIDACRGADSNLAAILAHLRAHHGEHKRWLRSVLYFLQFGTYAFYSGPGRLDFGYYDRAGVLAYLRAHLVILAFWLGIAVTVAWTVLRQVPALVSKRSAPAADVAADADASRRFLAWAGVFLGAAVFLTLYWGTIQDGPMLYYNAFFNYGIFYFGALVAFAAICGGLPVAWNAAPAHRRIAATSRALPALLVLTVYAVQVSHLHVTPWSAGPDEIRQGVAKMAAATTPRDTNGSATPKMLLFAHDEWPWVTAAALELDREKIPFLVTEEYSIIFGEEHGWHPRSGSALKQGIQIWRFPRSLAPPASPPVVPPVVLDPWRPVSLVVTAPVIDPNDPDRAGVIDFRIHGNAPAYLLRGWSGPETSWAWSDGPWAALAFSPRPVNGGNVELHADLSPLLSPPRGITGQRMRVFFNGEPLGGERRLDNDESHPAQLPLIIPAAAWNRCAAHPDDCAVLEFEFPDAVSPASLDPTGANRDVRVLGMRFVTLRFQAVLATP